MKKITITNFENYKKICEQLNKIVDSSPAYKVDDKNELIEMENGLFDDFNCRWEMQFMNLPHSFTYECKHFFDGLKYVIKFEKSQFEKVASLYNAIMRYEETQEFKEIMQANFDEASERAQAARECKYDY